MLRLDLEYKEALLDWSTHAASCSCSNPDANPPCGSCSHPGHPHGLENDQCWYDADGIGELDAAINRAEQFAVSKGFEPSRMHSARMYAMAWYKDGKAVRYILDVENERPMFSASCNGYHTGLLDTIEAAYVAAELANWSKP